MDNIILNIRDSVVRNVERIEANSSLHFSVSKAIKVGTNILSGMVSINSDIHFHGRRVDVFDGS